MPDWERLVAKHVGDAKLAPEVQREVVAEIATHLEDRYDDLRESGCGDAEAQTNAQVSDWKLLWRQVRRAKENDMSFVRRVLIPGTAAVIMALVALRVCVSLLIAPQPCGPDMTCIRMTADGPAYLPWLATLPLAGALATALGRRTGARPVERLVAAIFPAVYFAGETIVMSLLDDFFWRIPIYWVMIPAVACAIGALPFLGGHRDADAPTLPPAPQF